jgi:SAM-dependent methyltransferase
MLAPDMRAKTPWQAAKSPPFNDVERTLSGRIWAGIPGGHKWLGYFPIYDREFGRFRGTKPRILEIGVYKGASLLLWNQFFGEGVQVVGVDIDPNCMAFSKPEQNIFVEIGDQSDAAFLQSIVEKYGPFDIIIDDGSHIASHQIASFNALFLAGLKDDGVYLVEDLECMYWGHTDAFRDAPTTSVDFFKMLIDVQNSIYEDYTYNDFSLNIPGSRTEYTAIELAKSIAGLKFLRGVVVVDKAQQIPPLTLHL